MALKKKAKKAKEAKELKKTKKKVVKVKAEKPKNKKAKEPSVTKLAVKTSQNCLFCVKFNKCDNKKKSHKYICSLYKPYSEKKVSVELEAPVIIKKQKKSSSREGDTDFELMARSYNELASISPLPPDIRVDDRDIPQAPNFFEFSTGKRYLNTTPFAKQIEVGVHLFAEYCPNKKCTDLEYIFDIPKYDDENNYGNLRDKVTFLNFGVCPKCGYRKSEMKKDGHKIPYAMAGSIGQRCITGNSLVVTHHGIMPIKNTNPTSVEGFSDYKKKSPKLVLENGAVVTPSKFFVQHNQTIHKVTMKNGYTVSGTPEHPLMSKDDFIKISSLKLGDAIPIIVGQNLWGNTVLDLSKDIQPKYKEIISKQKTYKLRSKIKPYTGKLTPSMYRLLGYWVSEGANSRIDITNRDQEVLDNCYDALCELYGKKHVRKLQYRILCDKLNAKHHFNLILENKIHTKSNKKQIPQHVMSAPKKMVVEFCRALFEGDGGFNGKAVEYCSISKKLITQLSAILHNIGIVHKIIKGTTWATNGSVNQVRKPKYSIFIEGKEALTQFEDNIGFISKRKSERLELIVNSIECQTIDMPFWYDKFPDSIKQEYLSLIAEMAKDIGKYKTWRHNTRYDVYCHGQNYGFNNIFDNNHPHYRLEASNVALSRQRIHSEYAYIRYSSIWKLLSVSIKSKLMAFVEKYTQKNHYWTEVLSNKKQKKTKTVYDFHIPEHHRFMANGLLNHNSGKSQGVAMIIPYHTHGMLKLQNAPKVYGLLDNTTLEFTMVALTATKAKELLYDPVAVYLNDSPWYKEYHALLDHYGEKYGEELYKIRDTFASYRCRSMLLKISDPDMRKLRGATRVGFAIDELDWFISGSNQAVKFNAKEILKSLTNSLKTVRNSYHDLLDQGMDGILTPIDCSISSPSSNKGLCTLKYKRSFTSPDIVGFNYATWEFSPKYKKSSFKEEMREDPIATMRDFGAVPPNSSAPFISDIDHIRGIVAKERRNTVNFIPQTIISMGGKQMGSGKVMFVGPKDQNKRIMAIDAGYNNNSFAILCGYWDTNLERPIIDTFVEIPATMDLPLNYNDIFAEIIYPIIDQLNVKAMIADRFQSLKFLQDTENDKQILAETHSVKYGEFEAFRGDLLDHNVIIPKPEIKRFDDILEIAANDYPHGFRRSPISHFLHQIVTVQDLKKEVIKGEGLTDDLFRAAVLLHSYLVDLQYRDYCTGTTNIVVQSKVIAGVYSGRTSGINTHNSAGTMANAGAGIAISSRG